LVGRPESDRSHALLPGTRSAFGDLAYFRTSPGSSSEFSGLTIFGGGLARRLNDQFIASVSVTTVTPYGAPSSGDELRTFEVGIHLGYGWNP